MVPADQPLVVKVSGSLFPVAERVVAALSGSTRPLLLVPGGGPFARLVRSLDLPEEQAHWMAILAMDQFGWYLARWGLPVTHEISLPVRVEILLPYRSLRESDPLPHSWDVTSDTIAAWVAARLGTDLLVLKSVEGITGAGTLIPRIHEPIPCSEVDPSLIPFTLSHRMRTTILNGRAEGRIRDFLEGRDVPGTVIEPRL